MSNITTVLTYPRFVFKEPRRFKYHLPQESWVLISICTKPKEKLFTTDEQVEELRELGCKDLVTVFFADLTIDKYDRIQGAESENLRSLKLFTWREARVILAFIDKHRDTDIKTLTVHCDGGVCRSGAVGLFACRYLGLDETRFRKQNRSIDPNPHVLDILYKASGMRDKYIKMWESLPDTGSLTTQ